jgi:hypothetical protein
MVSRMKKAQFFVIAVIMIALALSLLISYLVIPSQFEYPQLEMERITFERIGLIKESIGRISRSLQSEWWDVSFARRMRIEVKEGGGSDFWQRSFSISKEIDFPNDVDPLSIRLVSSQGKEIPSQVIWKDYARKIGELVFLYDFEPFQSTEFWIYFNLLGDEIEKELPSYPKLVNLTQINGEIRIETPRYRATIINGTLSRLYVKQFIYQNLIYDSGVEYFQSRWRCTEWYTQNYDIPSVEVIEEGPNLVALKISGSHRNSAGEALSGESYVQYQYFYPDFIKIKEKLTLLEEKSPTDCPGRFEYEYFFATRYSSVNSNISQISPGTEPESDHLEQLVNPGAWYAYYHLDASKGIALVIENSTQFSGYYHLSDSTLDKHGFGALVWANSFLGINNGTMPIGIYHIDLTIHPFLGNYSDPGAIEDYHEHRNDLDLKIEYISLWFDRSWKFRRPIFLEEKIGITRENEPIEIFLEIDPGKVLNCSKEIRVTEGELREIPSQVYNESYLGGWCISSNIFFLANVSANQTKEYYVYYGNPAATAPNYGHLFGIGTGFFDDFNEPDGPAAGWSAVEGVWNVENGEYVCESTGGSDTVAFRAVTNEEIAEDGVITAKVKLDPSNCGDAGPLLRMVDDNNGYGVRIQGDDYVSIRKIKNGNASHILYVSKTIDCGVWYWVKFWVEGSQLKAKAWEVGTPEPTIWDVETTDTEFTGRGKVGVYQDRGGPSRFDDVKVNSLPLIEVSLGLEDESGLELKYESLQEKFEAYSEILRSSLAERGITSKIEQSHARVSKSYSARVLWQGPREWFDLRWKYRREIEINNMLNPNELVNYQILLTLDTQKLIAEKKLRSDCADLRFTDSAQQEIPHWLEGGCNTNETKTWVKVPRVPARWKTNIFFYYGNSLAESKSNGSATFEFFDDFEEWSGWEDVGTGNVAQTTTYVYQASYALIKQTNCDPNGGRKSLGFTLDRNNWIVEFHRYRHSGDGTDCYADRTGAEDANGNGYSAGFTHGSSPQIYIDRRDTGTPTQLEVKSTTDILSGWYIAQLVLTPDEVKTRILYTNYMPHDETSTTDQTHSSFTYIYIRGGRPYYVDIIKIRKFTSPEPTYSFSEEEEARRDRRTPIFVYSTIESDDWPLEIRVEDRGLVSFWKLDEGDGNITYDSSDYKNDGLLKDANTTNDDGNTPPQWTDGKFGYALRFDGIDDYVRVEDSPSLDIVDEITIEAWIYLAGERDEEVVYNFVMTHSPYKQYDPGTETYNPAIGRTPSSAGESIRYLRKVYEITQNSTILQKIKELADYLVEIQNVTDETVGWYGGFPSLEGATTYYSIDAVFGGEGLLDAYELTSNDTYLERAEKAAGFLRHMQTRDEVGLVDEYYGGFCEYVDSSNGAYLTRMYTKLLLAVPFLDRLYKITGNVSYVEMRDDSLNFLRNGLTSYYEYFDPPPYGDKNWHRISVNDVYADSVAYALRALYEYEGLSDTVKSVYDFYQSFGGYDTRFGWAGYLNVVDKLNDSNYYDVAVTGLLSEIRMAYDWDSYTFSRKKAKELGDRILYWGLNFTYEANVTRWQDTVTASEIGSLFINSDGSILSKGSSYGLGLDEYGGVAGHINGVILKAPISAEWRHVVFVYNGSIMKIYIDGEINNSIEFSDLIGISAIDLILGNYFNGTVDEMKIYGRALNQEEIRKHFQEYLDRNSFLVIDEFGSQIPHQVSYRDRILIPKDLRAELSKLYLYHNVNTNYKKPSFDTDLLVNQTSFYVENKYFLWDFDDYDFRTFYFKDDFEDEVADEWIPLAGEWAVEDGEYSQSNTTLGWPTTGSLIDMNISDGILQVKAKVVEDRIAGIIFRSIGSDNHYILFFEAGDGYNCTLKSRPDDVTLADPAVAETQDLDEWWWLKAYFNGSTIKIKCWKDGTSEPDWLATVTNTNYSYGKIGVFTYQGHAHFDDVKVTSLNWFTSGEKWFTCFNFSLGCANPVTGLENFKFIEEGPVRAIVKAQDNASLGVSYYFEILAGQRRIKVRVENPTRSEDLAFGPYWQVRGDDDLYYCYYICNETSITGMHNIGKNFGAEQLAARKTFTWAGKRDNFATFAIIAPYPDLYFGNSTFNLSTNYLFVSITNVREEKEAYLFFIDSIDWRKVSEEVERLTSGVVVKEEVLIYDLSLHSWKLRLEERYIS